jgi:hypothetical protein
MAGPGGRQHFRLNGGRVRRISRPSGAAGRRAARFCDPPLTSGSAGGIYGLAVVVPQPQTKTATVQVCEYRPEVRTRRIQETIMTTQAQVVRERVPYTVCVHVPYQVQVCVPVPCP